MQRVQSKVCTGCKQDKILSEFDKHPKGYQRRNPRCKMCRAEYMSKRYVNFTPEQREDHFLKKKHYALSVKRFSKHGISQDIFFEMAASQENKCAICQEDIAVDKLVIDHCHKNKNVRGLLCTRCNCGLGMFRDDVGFLEAAILYLRRDA